jgi:radical SAM protein with 4Fe4S-binding SPASM domain
MPAAPRFTLRLEADRALLYDRAAHQYFTLTAGEAFLCSASREVSLDDATAMLGEQLGVRQARAVRKKLTREGSLDERGFTGRVIEHRDVAGAYGAPLVCHLGVTLACNFACNHCYSSSGQRAKDELTLDDIERLVDQLVDLGCLKLVLGGGEPFLRKELPDIVAYADARGVDCFVHTNASLVRAEVLERLAKTPPAALAVSLDGPDAETNDRVRGPKAFEKTLAGLAVLRAHWPHGFNLSATVTPVNADLTPRLVALAKEQGAKVLLLRPAYPAGEAMKDQTLVCDRDTFAHAIDLARAEAKRLKVTLDAPHPHEQGEPDFEGFGCVAARVVLGVDPRGNVTPCLNLPGGFDSGNVRTKKLVDLWRKGRGFVLIRAQQAGPQCSTCKHYDTCRGGCRVRALYADNGLGGPDSWCHYEPVGEDSTQRERRAER